jgi:ABC-type lipoprotein export system ATPase subunit
MPAGPVTALRVSDFSDAQRSRIRLEQVGFVFQRFFLLPMLSAR